MAIDYISFLQERGYSYASYIEYAETGDSYFIAQNSHDEHFIIRNFNESGPYQEIKYTVSGYKTGFFGAIVRRDDRWLVYVNERESDAFESIIGLYLSPSQEHYAFIAFNGGSYILFIDGEVVDKFENISDFTFTSLEKDDYAFIATNEKEKTLYKNRERVVSLPNIVGVKVSSSGEYAYIAPDQGKRRVFSTLGDSELYENIGDLVISPDGKGYGFVAQDSGRWRMIVNRNEYGEFDMVRGLKFGQTLDDFIYIGERGLEQVIMKNKDEVASFEYIKGYGFIPDSSHIGYVGVQDAKEISGEY